MTTTAVSARRRLTGAVRSGRVVRLPCEVCGASEGIHAHHGRGYDDAHALDVTWLCRRHHIEAHGKRVKPSWEHGARAYINRTRPSWMEAKTWSYAENSGPKHLLLTLERVWRLLRTDEEREHALALVGRLSEEAAA